MNTKKQNKKKKGFTLIELIIVIAIIAILAAIAIPNFLSIQRKAKVKADIASAKTVYDATSALIAEGKIVPGSKDATVLANVTPIDGTKDVNADIQDIQNYLQTIPKPESVDNAHFAVKITGTESNPVIQIYIDGTSDVLVYPNPTDAEYQLN
ncbi:prepilin-type N-terminal cleavage/methylation domain-containing protein [Clostridium sp. LIBA-8841]|uniref:prepilin-type N-terminal cleavage/methylation domain-containing protein n=1 Tax=Clostridium sp. LIBA-8841 TaxID=2987530 RepID=UPI002AC62581|nr:prepilin-type N-terminal cleavage/methylation domain-containing protein [Clostridium sp. LIBA-8841]MDZ5255064.1 prepilin-type N-terminal cleavage/methylation domain-containing protein [Clostridium sp. LIBA-8841]